ncbi:PadR family transcriptional regulator [Candidatus Leptofilum sp.]|uniref:PadR family transcriptional regulator n=1 Tax=Candidatus Leptofilum sp. TaxID=3241576 RepID=UPI003B596E6A
MSLRYAILGILNVMPMTGYDLKHQAFDATVRHFWPADQSQIYRTLNKLAEDGLVTVTVEAQAERPDRKVYAITPAGQATLKDWLTSDQAVPILRDSLLVQLFFGQELPRDELLRVVAGRLAQHQQRLAIFEQVPIPPADSRPDDRWLALQHLTLDFGLALERAYISWLEHCQEVIAAMPDADEVPDFRDRFDAPTED